MSYTQEYIKLATTSDEGIQPPDAMQCSNREFMVLDALYHAHEAGGAKQAKQALTMAFRLVPEIKDNLNGNGSGSNAAPDLEHQPDDDEISLLLADEWNNKYSFFHGEWRQYDGGFWQTRQQPEIQIEVRQFLRRFRKVGVKVSQAKVKAIAAMLQDDCFIPDRAVNDVADERRKYIPLENGLFNVETMMLESHNPSLFFTNQMNFEYDPVATAPMWQAFLNSSLVLNGTDTPDEEMIMALQEYLAYSMTARTDMKASFWLYGKPDSGKSTLLSLIRGMMGTLHSTIDLNTLGGNRFMLSGIIGARVVTFSEADQGVVLPDGLYKALVGGSDEIYADVKNKPGVTFTPEAKLWWAMNNAPRTTDRSGAMLNRLYPILFNRSIPKSQRISNLDKELHNERPGIFNWLLIGYRRLVEQGKFTVSTQAESWKESYKLENDTELSFVQDACIQKPDAFVQSQNLYDEYRAWCERNGFRAKNINQASKEWERLGFEKFIRDGYRFWRGVGLLLKE